MPDGRHNHDRDRCHCNLENHRPPASGAHRARKRAHVNSLSLGQIAHVGFEQDGKPYVIPTLYHYWPERPDRLYIHGGLSSRMLKRLAGQGEPVCATVTQIDGLVYSLATPNFTRRIYRSVICFGHGRILEDEQEKRALFEDHDAALFPGPHCRPRLYSRPIGPLAKHGGGRDRDRRNQRQDAGRWLPRDRKMLPRTRPVPVA